jgi:hypothetical protein
MHDAPRAWKAHVCIKGTSKVRKGSSSAYDPDAEIPNFAILLLST